jgi:hypothetical protein
MRRQSKGMPPCAARTLSSDSLPSCESIMAPDLQKEGVPLEPPTEARTKLNRDKTAAKCDPSAANKDELAHHFWDRRVSETVGNLSPVQPAKPTDEEDTRSWRKAGERVMLPRKVKKLEEENKKIRRLLKQRKAENDQRLKALKRKKQEGTFKYSDDYRWVRIRGRDYRLTPMQAQVIQILHKAYLDSKPELGVDRILAEIDARSSRLRDIFRSRPGSWGNLVKKTSRGVVRLNI